MVKRIIENATKIFKEICYLFNGIIDSLRMNKILSILRHPITALLHPGRILYPHTWCNEVFIEYLRSCGAVIGRETRFISPENCNIDLNRAPYISIGNNCCLSYVTILAHDYSWYTFLDACQDILPDAGGKVIIGNNCFVGYQTVILKGTVIEDNVIIGARSVVKGKIPSNTVWAGCPAKMICTLDEFYEKRKKRRIQDALYRRDFIREKKHRAPTIEEMGLFSVLFLERSEENYNRYIQDVEFNGIKSHPRLKDYFFSTVPLYSSYKDFLNESNVFE